MKWTVVISLLLILVKVVTSRSRECGPGDRFIVGEGCQPCPECLPGTGLLEACGFGQGEELRCVPCPEDTFHSDPKDNRCVPCTNCTWLGRRHDYRCRPMVNAECGTCLPGFYDHYRAVSDGLYHCLPCRYSPDDRDCESWREESAVNIPVTMNDRQTKDIYTADEATPSEATAHIKGIHTSHRWTILLTAVLGLLCLLLIIIPTLIFWGYYRLKNRQPTWICGEKLYGDNGGAVTGLLNQTTKGKPPDGTRAEEAIEDELSTQELDISYVTSRCHLPIDLPPSCHNNPYESLSGCNESLEGGKEVECNKVHQHIKDDQCEETGILTGVDCRPTDTNKECNNNWLTYLGGIGTQVIDFSEESTHDEEDEDSIVSLPGCKEALCTPITVRCSMEYERMVTAVPTVAGPSTNGQQNSTIKSSVMNNRENMSQARFVPCPLNTAVKKPRSLSDASSENVQCPDVFRFDDVFDDEGRETDVESAEYESMQPSSLTSNISQASTVPIRSMNVCSIPVSIPPTQRHLTAVDLHASPQSIPDVNPQVIPEHDVCSQGSPGSDLNHQGSPESDANPEGSTRPQQFTRNSMEAGTPPGQEPSYKPASVEEPSSGMNRSPAWVGDQHVGASCHLPYGKHEPVVIHITNNLSSQTASPGSLPSGQPLTQVAMVGSSPGASGTNTITLTAGGQATIPAPTLSPKPPMSCSQEAKSDDKETYPVQETLYT